MYTFLSLSLEDRQTRKLMKLSALSIETGRWTENMKADENFSKINKRDICGIKYTVTTTTNSWPWMHIQPNCQSQLRRWLLWLATQRQLAVNSHDISHCVGPTQQWNSAFIHNLYREGMVHLGYLVPNLYLLWLQLNVAKTLQCSFILRVEWIRSNVSLIVFVLDDSWLILRV